MATSAANAIFGRELLELRLSGALFAAFQSWTAIAVNQVLEGLVPDVNDALTREVVLAAVPNEYQAAATDYLSDVQFLADAVDVLTEVHQYARAQGMGEDATRTLMRSAVKPGRGLYAPLPTRLLEVTRVRELVPVLAPARSPLPEHPSLLAPEVPFAEYGHTYRTRLEAIGRTVATSLSGRAARAEAQRTGQDLRWVTTGDNRVRDSHRAAQGQTVAADEWFRVGGIPMEYPGDPAAPRDEIANCRCVLTLVTPPERRYVQRYIPREWLAASAPMQARAPKGVPIGGQWIDTPHSILDQIMAESRGETLPPANGGYTPQRIADEYAAALTAAWDDPTLEVTINGMSGGDTYGTKLMGIITDRATGDPVGDFERTMYADGRVEHDQFRLVEDYQGKGMGSKMQAASEDYYRSLGYDRIELKAGLDVGGYTWAKQGYEFQGQLTAYDVAYYVRDTISRMPGVTPEARRQADDIFARVEAEAAAAGDEDTSYLPTSVLPVEIAMIGWTEGADLWPGKEAMLGYEWFGVKHLGGGAITAAAANPVANAIAALHRDWVPRARYDSIPVPPSQPSQYAETEEDVYTHPDSDAEFWVPVRVLLGQTTLTAALLPNVPSAAPGADLSAPDASPAVYAAPTQARAPKGVPIGGEWIDTPNALLHGLGWEGEAPGTPDAAYSVPSTNPPDWEPEMFQHGMNTHMPTRENYTQEQVNAIGNYTGQQNVPMNTWLREGKLDWAYPGSTEERVQSDIADFDTTFTPIPGDTPVYRGLGGRLDTDNLDGLVGSVIADEGYLSTSLNPWATTPFGGGIGADKPILHITVPKGTPVVWPGEMATVSGEMEVVLPHGTPLAITGWHWDERMKRNVVDAVVAAPANPSLTAAAPIQARAPKGTAIGGQWIDTPGGMLRDVTYGGPVLEAERDVDVDEADVPAEQWDPSTQFGQPGAPMSYREMVAEYTEVNPGSGLDGGMVNCQRTATAWEMRARGYDVVAPPASGVDGNAMNIESMWANDRGQTTMFTVLPKESAFEAIWGSGGEPGARYIVIGHDPVSMVGHAWNAEVQPDGSVFEWDPQSKTRMDTKEWGISNVHVLRVDDKHPTSTVAYDGGRKMPPWAMTPQDFQSQFGWQLGDW